MAEEQGQQAAEQAKKSSQSSPQSSAVASTNAAGVLLMEHAARDETEHAQRVSEAKELLGAAALASTSACE